jgi:hypothetical protein
VAANVVVDAPDAPNALDVAPRPLSQIMREWEEMVGWHGMLYWVVGDEDDEKCSFFEFSRAKHGRDFALVAAGMEKGKRFCFCKCY